MKKIIFLLSLVTFMGQAQQTWKPVSAIISFKIKHSGGINANGSFKGFVGSVSFDKDKLAASSLRGTINATTIDTDNSVRDKVLRGEEYFDVAKYEKITMTSTKIEKGKGANDYVGTFQVTIKNVTKTVSFPFTFEENDAKGVLKGSFSLNRLDYGVGEKSMLLANTATISLLLNVQK